MKVKVKVKVKGKRGLCEWLSFVFFRINVEFKRRCSLRERLSCGSMCFCQFVL